MIVSSCQDPGILARIVHDFTDMSIAAVIRRLEWGNHLNITHAYRSAMKQHGHVEDRAQLRVVGEMQKLLQQIMRDASLAGRLRRLLSGSIADRPRGIYLWGGVGRGKTFLMDLFFGSLNIRNKKRIHFHRMMRDIHSRLKNLQDVSNPLDRVAADIAGESRVLCFDEFFVSDVGDAMILGRLLEGLFDRGVVLVATSNARPEDL